LVSYFLRFTFKKKRLIVPAFTESINYFIYLFMQMKNLGHALAGISFLSAWSFFQFAYPYHLMRREQLDLFLYDWHCIKETYSGTGWLARFLGDFVEQFFCFPVAGPVIIALILAGTAAVTNRICRHFLRQWPSLIISAVVFLWSFLRETGNLFTTQYSLSVLGYLSLILLALQFGKKWMKLAAGVLLLGLGVFSFGSPTHKHYGRLIDFPSIVTDKLIAMDIHTVKGNWDKVLKLSERDMHDNIASYFYNLAIAEKGTMGNDFFKHSQGPLAGTLFLRVDDDCSQFSNGAAGEVWFRLGDMTKAEQSTVVALQISPRHSGARFLVRLAEIALISGEEDTASKYLNILSKTLVYRKWALDRIPGRMSGNVRAWLAGERAKLPREDFVYGDNGATRDLLKGLLDANPDNMLARQYLLMYDLEIVRLDEFMEDYGRKMIPGTLFEQAMLVWMSRLDILNEDNIQKYGISRKTMQKFDQFFRYPDRYTDTYWYYVVDVTSK